MTTESLGLVLLSALLHALWSASIKGSRNPLAFNVLQVGPSTLVGLALLPWMGLSQLPQAFWAVLAVTALAHGLYFFWMTRAYEAADLSVVYPIARSTPAFLPLLAVPLVGDSISPAGVLGIVTVVAGMWLVQSGGQLHWRALVGPGTRFAYLTLAATVVYSLCDKSAMTILGGQTWEATVPRAVTYYFLITLSSTGVFLVLALPRLAGGVLRRSVRTEGAGAALASLVSFGSYVLILQALQSASVSYVVAVRQTSVLFVLLIGIVWLGERPGRPRVLGALATVAGVALIALAPGQR